MTHIDHYDKSLEDGNLMKPKVVDQPKDAAKDKILLANNCVFSQQQFLGSKGAEALANEEVSGIVSDMYAAMDEFWNVGYEAGKKEAQFKMRQDVKRFLETHSPYNDPNFFHIHLMEVINGFKK